MKRRFFCILLALLLLPLLPACEKKAAPTDYTLVENGTATLYVQIPADASPQILYARDRLVTHVQSLAGVTLPSGSEPNPPTPFVLMLGETREELGAKLADKLEADTLMLRAEGNRLYLVATNDAFLYDGVELLISKLQKGEDGALRWLGIAEERAAGDKTSLRYLFTQGSVVDSSAKLLGHVPFHPDGIKGTQGGCIVGNYLYQAFVKADKESDELHNITYIGKYDMTTQSMVTYSELLDLNHANDITYNSKTNELLVVHNKPRYKQLSIIDPETLTLKRTVELPGPVYSITYNAARDQYMVGRSNGQNIQPVSADFQFLVTEPYQATPLTKHYTTQGICSDDTFVYCVLYDSLRGNTSAGQHVITVYDWYGNYVGMIHFDNGRLEPENISIEGGRITVLSYDSKKGGALHEITPTAVKTVAED